MVTDESSNPDVEKQQAPLPLPTTKEDDLTPPGTAGCYEYYCKAMACFWPAAPLALAVVLVAGTAQLVARQDYFLHARLALQTLIACMVTSFLARCVLIIPDQPDGAASSRPRRRLVHARACAVAEHVLQWSIAMLCVVTVVVYLAVVRPARRRSSRRRPRV